jgi:hypothetical protein
VNVRRFLGVVIAAASTSCAVLTQSQIDSVHDYAKVTKDYVALPPKVIDAFAAAHAEREVLKLRPTADAPQKVDDIVTRRLKWRDDSQQLSTALAVLISYSELLEKLAAADLTDADGALTDMGTTLDQNIGAYNAKKGTSLPSLGSAIAAGAHALGGVVLAQRQAAIIKASVDKGDDVIQPIMKDVTALLWPYASKNPDSNFTADIDALKGELGTAVARPAFSYDEARGYYATLLAYRDGQRLADGALEATQACAKAHGKLKEALSEKLSLSHVVDEVRAYGNLVSAAMKVKADVENAEKSK